MTLKNPSFKLYEGCLCGTCDADLGFAKAHCYDSIFGKEQWAKTMDVMARIMTNWPFCEVYGHGGDFTGKHQKSIWINGGEAIQATADGIRAISVEKARQIIDTYEDTRWPFVRIDPRDAKHLLVRPTAECGVSEGTLDFVWENKDAIKEEMGRGWTVRFVQ